MPSILTSELLNQASNEDLQPLVDYIMKASTEMLSVDDTYKRHSPNHRRYADEIFAEIKSFGGNTFANIFRGGGPRYVEVVCDVAGKFDIDDPEDCELEELEQKIILKILQDTYNNAQGKDREELDAALRDAGIGKKDWSAFMSGGSLAAILGAKMAGFAFYQVSLIVANAVARQVLGHGLRLATNAALARSLAVFTGPIGWVITGLWTVLDLSGPAYRVTVPCVIHIAMLRQKYLHEVATEGMEEAFVDG